MQYPQYPPLNRHVRKLQIREVHVPKPYLFLFSSSAISCLCCLFESMVKEMSGALLCWVGCWKTWSWHYLIWGMWIHMWDGVMGMQRRKRTLFHGVGWGQEQKIKLLFILRANSPAELLYICTMENKQPFLRFSHLGARLGKGEGWGFQLGMLHYCRG